MKPVSSRHTHSGFSLLSTKHGTYVSHGGQEAYYLKDRGQEGLLEARCEMLHREPRSEAGQQPVVESKQRTGHLEASWLPDLAIAEPLLRYMLYPMTMPLQSSVHACKGVGIAFQAAEAQQAVHGCISQMLLNNTCGRCATQQGSKRSMGGVAYEQQNTV